MQACRDRGIGFIAMKALAGGLITNSAAAFAYIAQFENVLPIWGIQRETELEEFLRYMESPPAMTPELEAVIAHDRQELVGDFCRGCGYCMPCPMGIEISSCARMSLMLRRAPSAANLTPEAQAMMKKIETCLHCGPVQQQMPLSVGHPNPAGKKLCRLQARPLWYGQHRITVSNRPPQSDVLRRPQSF